MGELVRDHHVPAGSAEPGVARGRTITRSAVAMAARPPVPPAPASAAASASVAGNRITARHPAPDLRDAAAGRGRPGAPDRRELRAGRRGRRRGSCSPRTTVGRARAGGRACPADGGAAAVPASGAALHQRQHPGEHGAAPLRDGHTDSMLLDGHGAAPSIRADGRGRPWIPGPWIPGQPPGTDRSGEGGLVVPLQLHDRGPSCRCSASGPSCPCRRTCRRGPSR